jgi:N6-adenosine-specific RNA methylase IME4
LRRFYFVYIVCHKESAFVYVSDTGHSSNLPQDVDLQNSITACMLKKRLGFLELGLEKDKHVYLSLAHSKNKGFNVAKYHIIYADPPWSYNSRSNTGTKFGGGAMGHYPVMDLAQIKSLDVQSICHDNAVLFLWATFPRLPQALEVMEAWGFTYKTLGFSWHKLTKGGDLFFGVGSYAKSNCEVCLMGIRGKVGLNRGVNDPMVKLEVNSNCVSSAINSVRERHSKKPSEVRSRIVELFGDLARIELFARENPEGWAVWGNQVNKSG